MSDFLRTNLPYGIKKNDENKWMIFNRDYLPLGMTRKEEDSFRGNEKKFYFAYKGVTEKLLDKLGEGENIKRDENGKITEVWLYNDGTVPTTMNGVVADRWEIYQGKLKLLCLIQAI
ncbi:hypothetical protein [Bacteroides ihuae]|uniref:hypothetical protein n=1 Tax=Bacteroides ihuae TaxID=1852362 RepID=UPI0008D953A6|nr:hypothetical protein [Bacteroides ihuae]